MSKDNETRYNASNNTCVLDLMFKPDGLYMPMYGNTDMLVQELKNRAFNYLPTDLLEAAPDQNNLIRELQSSMEVLNWEPFNPLLTTLFLGSLNSYIGMLDSGFFRFQLSLETKNLVGSFTITKANLKIGAMATTRVLDLEIVEGVKKTYDEKASKEDHAPQKRRRSR